MRQQNRRSKQAASTSGEGQSQREARTFQVWVGKRTKVVDAERALTRARQEERVAWGGYARSANGNRHTWGDRVSDALRIDWPEPPATDSKDKAE